MVYQTGPSIFPQMTLLDPGSGQPAAPGCGLSLADSGAEGLAPGAALGGVPGGGAGHRRALVTENTKGIEKW